MAPHTTLEVDGTSGCAVVTLHNPPVNALHPAGLWELGTGCPLSPDTSELH